MEEWKLEEWEVKEWEVEEWEVEDGMKTSAGAQCGVNFDGWVK